ncbi:O-fucosyltransferase 37 [Magnolia sinica]|uniref:O-fucosyltransferase 37 n=1 Tax=Magnolia sinica TaxID=86752 RepID=UPI0026594631|nr:O-fucosyltransferase 37 [Magnolia sinica]
MATRSKNPRTPFSVSITPSHLHHCLLLSPKKRLRQYPSHTPKLFSFTSPNLSLLFLFLFLFLFTFVGISKIYLLPISDRSMRWDVFPSSSSPFPSFSSLPLFLTSHFVSNWGGDSSECLESAMMPFPINRFGLNLTDEEQEFWRQPDRLGYGPCIEFGIEYRKASARIVNEKRKFLMVVVSGGLNQQRNQIIDAVVVARILEAALIVPILKVNMVWEDESEFSDIFDVEHFKRTLKSDVWIVSSLPSTHLIPKSSIGNRIPINASPLWIRTRFLKQLNEEGLLLLNGGFDSKLSKNLPLDLQRLRCKVAFHALRFVAPIRELGNLMARRMRTEGPYIALHLRLEKDVWIRTGCLPGLGPEYDGIIKRERESQPELLTGSLNMNSHDRKLAGLCPLNALEVARILKALGAPRSARVYMAGGEPFGGLQALQPLKAEFPNLVKKEMLAFNGELEHFANRSSVLAAIDYIVSLNSDVFMPSHGGNMGSALQGHRAYVGHRKYIKPNKRVILQLLMETSLSNAEFSVAMKRLHRGLLGQPEIRTKKGERDVIAYPVPECMCKRRTVLF